MKKIITYYFTFLIIILSKSVFFGIKYSLQTNIAFFVSAGVILILNFNIKNYNFKRFYIMLLILGINLLLNVNSGIHYTEIIFLIILAFTMSVVQSNIYINEFKKAFINIMTVLCIVSLICFISSQFISMYKFPFYMEEYVKGSYFNYSFYNTFGWGELFNRNAGIFWEPGAFQTYLNLALICLIFSVKENSKLFFTHLLIIVITIISTESTTGYIVLLVILVYALMTNKLQLLNSKSIIIVITSVIITVIIAVSSIYLITNSYVVMNKFNNRGQDSSYSIRENDQSSTIDIIKKYPITGVGFASDLNVYEENSRNIHNNSNGFLNFVEKFGIPISVLYLYFLFYGIRKFYDTSNIRDCILIFVIFIILNCSEGVILLPLFFSFLFVWRE